MESIAMSDWRHLQGPWVISNSYLENPWTNSRSALLRTSIYDKEWQNGSYTAYLTHLLHIIRRFQISFSSKTFHSPKHVSKGGGTMICKIIQEFSIFPPEQYHGSLSVPCKEEAECTQLRFGISTSVTYTENPALNTHMVFFCRQLVPRGV